MEAKSLMIGDWVYLHGMPHQVNFLEDEPDDHIVNTIGFYCLSAAQNPAWIHPIPLTAEILKLNGFDYMDSDNQWHLQDGLYIIFELSVNDAGEYYYGTFDTIKYVHQLQHILRLCQNKKLKELADNFKVK